MSGGNLSKNNMKFVILMMLVIVLSINFVAAIGVSPSKHVHEYMPGFERTDSFLVRPSTNSQPSAIIFLDEGPLTKYATLSKDKLDLATERDFKVYLDIPEDHGLVGKQILWVTIKESDPVNPGFLAVTTAVTPAIIVNFPIPGKYIEIGAIKAESVNIGEMVPLTWRVEALGEENTIFSAKLLITNSEGVEVYSKDYDSILVLGEEIYKQEEMIPSEAWIPGKYLAKLNVEYEGENLEKTDDFMIGYQDISLEDYSPKVLINGSIRMMSFVVRNLWNGKFNQVSGEIHLNGTTTSTPTIDLDPFKSGTLAQYVDISKTPIGIYEGKLKVFFDEFEKEFSFTVNITEPPTEEIESEGLSLLSIAMIIVIVLLVALLIFFLYYSKSKKKKK